MRRRILCATILFGLCTAIYIGMYVLNVRKYVRTSGVGGMAIVSEDYRVCYELSMTVFFPLYWIDSKVLRPRYWERYPEPHPGASQS